MAVIIAAAFSATALALGGFDSILNFGGENDGDSGIDGGIDGFLNSFEEFGNNMAGQFTGDNLTNIINGLSGILSSAANPSGVAPETESAASVNGEAKEPESAAEPQQGTSGISETNTAGPPEKTEIVDAPGGEKAPDAPSAATQTATSAPEETSTVRETFDFNEYGKFTEPAATSGDYYAKTAAPVPEPAPPGSQKKDNPAVKIIGIILMFSAFGGIAYFTVKKIF